MLIGYSRVSTAEQTTDPQDDELRAAGCEQIFRDVMSGAKERRPGLDAMLDQLRKGDVVVVVRLDRLGRSLVQLLKTVEQLEKAKVGLRSLRENHIDTTTPGGKLIFHLFGALSEFERGLIHDRVQAGLAAARARGRFGGRPKEDHSHREAMAAALMADPANTVADVCRTLKVSRAHAYRLAKKGEQRKQPPAATPAVAAPIRAAMPAGSTAKPPRKGQKTTSSRKRKP